MADRKISELTALAASDIDSTNDVLAVVDTSAVETKKVTVGDLLAGAAASSHTHTLADITDEGTAAAKNVPASGDASATEVVMGNDTRLTDARTPTSHNHALNDLSDVSSNGASSGQFLKWNGTSWVPDAVSGSGEANQNAFSSVAVAGQTTVAADQQTDTLTLVAGTGISLSTDASGDSVTITNSVSDTTLTTEEVQDIIGAMVSGNTETNIAVTYDDASGKLNFSSTDTDTTYSVVDSSADGLAPQLPSAHGGKFLRADGTWVVPPDDDTVYSHPNHTGDVTSTGDGATTVAKLAGRTLASTAPSDGQALVWDNTNSQWEPGTVSGGGGASNQNAFSNVAVAGQTTVAADGETDTLTLVGGTGISLTTNASSDSVTITNDQSNTTYGVAAVDGSNGTQKKIRLSGSDSTTDDVTIIAGTGLSISRSGDAITLTNSVTDTDTTYSVSAVDGDNADEEKIRLTDSSGGTDDLVLKAGTGLSIARNGDKITLTNTVTDTDTVLTTEQVQDIVGAMVSGNSETNIAVTYDDSGGKLNFSSTDTDTTYSLVSSSANGLAPQLPSAHGGKFLKADGTWEVPPDTDTDTTYTAGDGLDLSGTEFSADLKANGGLKITSGEMEADEANIDHNALQNYSAAQHRTINDSATGTTDLWSASKISDQLAMKSPTTHGHNNDYIQKYSLEGASGDAAVLPTGGDSDRPDTPVSGLLRFHTGTSALEVYNGTNWVDTFHMDGLTSVTGDEANGWSAGDEIAIVDSSDSDKPKKIKLPAEIGVACSDETTAITTGDAATIMVPRGMTITEVKASLTSPSSSGAVDIDVRYGASSPPTQQSESIFNSSPGLSLAASAYKNNRTTFTDGSSGSQAYFDAAEDSFIVVNVGNVGTSSKGLKIWLLGYWT